MYTANTMSSAIEAMGLSLPYDASNPAVSAAKEREAFLPGRRAVRLIEKNIRPRDIITRKSLENAYTFVLALGGSTNAVLHLMAIAREAEVEWTLADFDRLGDKVPHLADLKPGGKYVMFDLYRVGGTPAVLKALARRRAPARRLHHRDRQDAGREPEGRAEHLREAAEGRQAARQADVRPRAHRHPARQPGPRGGGRQGRGPEESEITGPAKVFDGEEACFAAIQRGRSRRATSSSSAARGRSAGPGCARCCRSPAA